MYISYVDIFCCVPLLLFLLCINQGVKQYGGQNQTLLESISWKVWIVIAIIGIYLIVRYFPEEHVSAEAAVEYELLDEEGNEPMLYNRATREELTSYIKSHNRLSDAYLQMQDNDGNKHLVNVCDLLRYETKGWIVVSDIDVIDEIDEKVDGVVYVQDGDRYYHTRDCPLLKDRDGFMGEPRAIEKHHIKCPKCHYINEEI